MSGKIVQEAHWLEENDVINEQIIDSFETKLGMERILLIKNSHAGFRIERITLISSPQIQDLFNESAARRMFDNINKFESMQIGLIDIK